MRQQLTSLDLKYLVDEFKVIEGARVDKVYQTKKNVFYVRFFVSGQGKKVLKIVVPGLIFFTEMKFDAPMRPPGYCSFLRKYLEGGFVEWIRQHGFDRIVEIKFSNKVEGEVRKFILVLEMFSPGNMILCKEDYTILSPLEGKDWSNRSIRKGLKYEFPPEMPNVFDMDYENFREIVEGSDKGNIVKTLAMDLGLGGTYAEEVCYNVIDKKENKIGEKDVRKLFDSFKEMITREPSPVLYNEKKGFPFPLKNFEGEYKEMDSFSKAIDSLFKRERKPKTNKFTEIIKKQRENLSNIEKEAEDCRKKGDNIYREYQKISKILEDIREVREKGGWEAVHEKYDKSDVVKEINESKGEIILDI